MRSCLYHCRLVHARTEPVRHAFRRRLTLLYLDLSELPALARLAPLLGVDRPALLGVRRGDHLGDPARPLAEAVRDRVEASAGFRPEGPVGLLTQPRFLGVGFNPVSFHFCHGAGGALDAVVADVTSTPWGERHAYVVALRGGRAAAPAAKELHVSPFMPMDTEYEWRFEAPGARLRLLVGCRREGRRFFHAGLVGSREPLGRGSLVKAALREPLGSARGLAAIYAQALRLALRGAPFHAHPARARGELPA